jgi:hypothetical protein
MKTCHPARVRCLVKSLALRFHLSFSLTGRTEFPRSGHPQAAS